MHFNRKSAIFISIFLFILVMLVPIISASYLSWIQAKEIERDKLYTNAKNAIQRSRICLNEIYKTLDELDSYHSDACSVTHIRTMQDMIYNKSCINEIQAINNGKVICGTARDDGNLIKIASDGFVMPNDTIISLDAANFVKQGANLIRFQRANYAIAVKEKALTDLMTEPYIKIALVTEDGQVISSLNYYSPNSELINSAIKNPNIQETSGSLVAVYRTPGLYYIVSEPISYVIKQWYKSLWLFLPFALIMSIIACWAVLWSLRHRLSDLGELKIAVARREFIVYYQPIIDFKTGLCIGAESLVRWRKPDGTIISPDAFIPLAESSGLIKEITDQAIDSIVINLKTALSVNKDLHISINVSATDFNSKRIFEKLGTSLAGTGIEPQQIWIEITERGFIDFESARDSLLEARKLGYIIVIDDFGTGYSSLSYLKELHIDALKIDKSFVNSLNTDSVTSNVTEHIIDLAKELNLKIVAEGVETVEQANYLKQRQVDYAQGWLYAKALPLEEFIAFYQKHGAK